MRLMLYGLISWVSEQHVSPLATICDFYSMASLAGWLPSVHACTFEIDLFMFSCSVTQSRHTVGLISPMVILCFRFYNVPVNDSVLWFQVGFDCPLFSVENRLSLTYQFLYLENLFH
jgi:hypothetical protein